MLESPSKYKLIPLKGIGSVLVFSLFLLGALPFSQKISAQVPSFEAPRTSLLASRSLSEGQAGIRVKARSVLFGNARHCRAPATIDYKQVLDATPEMQQIQEEEIPKGSARYIILVAKAVKRIRKVVANVAVAEKRDCVVKEGAIRENPKDLEVVDLTDKVIENIEDVVIGDQED
jgi:hypothetical protein